jgi:putative peptidoglycan lipid II flippase
VAESLMRLLFQHGDFTAADTARVVPILMAYGSGVWAYCAIPVLYRGFYAVGERRIPVQVGIVAVGIDLLLNLSLIWSLAERGLAISTAISAVIQVALLSWLIQQRIGRLDWRHLATTTAKAIFSTGVMSAVYLAIWTIFPAPTGKMTEVAMLAGSILLATIAYFAVARIVGIEELQLLLRRSKPDS